MKQNKNYQKAYEDLKMIVERFLTKGINTLQFVELMYENQWALEERVNRQLKKMGKKPFNE